jgi:DNA polymerase-1
MMRLIVLTKFVSRKDEMSKRLASQGFSDVIFMGCFSKHFEGEPSRADLKDAQSHFLEIVHDYDPDAILTMGNEALFCATGHSGIMKWRGNLINLKTSEIPVMPTLALGAIDRNPSQIQLLYSDIRALHRAVCGESARRATPSKIHIVRDDESLAQFLTVDAKAAAFDLETSSFDELAPNSFIVSIAVTFLHTNGDKSCWAIPLSHKASPFGGWWPEVLSVVATKLTTQVPVRIAHNAKFDCRWLVQFDAAVPCNFDTMLAAHLLDENRFKGLKPLAQMLLNAPPWDIAIKGGKYARPWYEQYPLRDILRYNALDTWYTMGLYEVFRKELHEDHRLETLFKCLIMPASQSLVYIERHGAYVHREALEEGARIVSQRLLDIHDDIMQYVPEGTSDVNLNPSNFLRWFLYDHLGLDVIRKGKIGPSVSESTLSHLNDISPHPVLPLLLERVKWQKYQSGFFTPYKALITNESRLHTTFKLSGTVTGRLSSGKVDADKVTGSKASILRGINLQQVPRDPLVRGIFGSPEGWSFIETDYSQIELRIAAEVSNEPTLKQLYILGEDVHMTMAVRMTGKPASAVTKEERKKAKAVNFGFLYGMGWRKFIETAWDNYGLKVSEIEAQAARAAFFQQFPGLLKWHARQRRLAHKYQRIQSPFGRIRHLPDIVSSNAGVVGEAERQAINSPVQSMASDLCLLSLVLLDRAFRRKGLRAIPIGTVHDAINFECPNDELDVVIPLIKHTMENPPTEKLFGYRLEVPIVADISVGTAWGKGEEV